MSSDVRNARSLSVTVVGAAAVFDTIYPVERLPDSGEIVPILELGSADRYCGGSAPNIACVLARLGHQTNLLYPVGKDFPDSECERSWKALGVDLSGLTVSPDRRSGFACLFLIPGGESVCFAYPGAAQFAHPPKKVSFFSTVVFGPVLNDYTRPLLENALTAGRRVVLSGIGSAELLPFLSRITALVINHKEAGALRRATGTDQIEDFMGRYPDLQLYMTFGERGSVLYHQGEEFAIPPVKADRTVDPTGAGDAYAAGVVAGLVRGIKPRSCALLGAVCASFVVERFGAQTNLPSLAAVLDRLERQGLNLADEFSAYLNKFNEKDDDEG